MKKKNEVSMKEQEKKRVVIYTRCAKASEECFKLQEEQLLEFSKVCGFEVLKVIKDLGTGTCKKRFARMKKSLLRLKPEIVLATKYEILTREYNQRQELFNLLIEKRIELKVLNLPEEYNHPGKAKEWFENVENIRMAMEEFNEAEKRKLSNKNTKYVVLYTRTATDEKSSLESLRKQEEILLNYCRINGLTPLRIFRESPIHGTPGNVYNDLVDFIKSQSGKIESLLFTRWDRLSRNLAISLMRIQELKELKVSVHSIEQPIDFSKCDAKFMLALYIVMPEIEYNNISIRTKSGIIYAKQQGYWVSKPPFGYSMKKLNHRHRTLRPNKKSVLVNQAFKEVLTNKYSLENIRLKLRRKGLNLQKTGFLNMLKNPAYQGKIKLYDDLSHTQTLIKGLHEPIVSEKLFDSVQRVLTMRNKRHKSGIRKNNQFKTIK